VKALLYTGLTLNLFNCSFLLTSNYSMYVLEMCLLQENCRKAASYTFLLLAYEI